MDDSNIPLIVSAVLSVTCGVICAAITAPKMRNGIGWFFLGMIFGPIAIVVAVIAPPLTDPADEPPPMEPDTVDALAKLAELRDRGALTEAEFAAGKARLLASPAPTAPS